MNMLFKKTGWLSLIVLIWAFPGLAQTPVIESGQPDELRGVTKVFIGLDAQQREVVVREIEKQLPDLEIVLRPEDSVIHILFFLKETRDGRTEGLGTVIKMMGANHARTLFSFSDALPPIYAQHSIKSRGIEHTMPLKFAREFVKAYRKANGLR